jgi:hypothetical protein
MRTLAEEYITSGEQFSSFWQPENAILAVS